MVLCLSWARVQDSLHLVETTSHMPSNTGLTGFKKPKEGISRLLSSLHLGVQRRSGPGVANALLVLKGEWGSEQWYHHKDYAGVIIRIHSPTLP